MSEVKRQPVDYRLDTLVPDFIQEMGKLAHYGEEKYGAPEQYQDIRLIGDKSPINHIFNHMLNYMAGKPNERTQTLEGHLVSIAYNAMMEWFYVTRGVLPLEEIKPLEHYGTRNNPVILK